MEQRKKVSKTFICGIVLGVIIATLMYASRIMINRYTHASVSGGWVISSEYTAKTEDWQIRSFDFHSAIPFKEKTVDIEFRNGETITLTYDLVKPFELGSRTIVIYDFPEIGNVYFTHSEQPLMYISGDNPVLDGEYFYAG